jgi:hypothetical protein
MKFPRLDLESPSTTNMVCSTCGKEGHKSNNKKFHPATEETHTVTPPKENEFQTHTMEPWVHILDSLKYNGEEQFNIAATQIKECGKTWKGTKSQFEPRLFAYQTSDESRPEIFKKLGLYILPVKNGSYILIKTNVYMSLDYSHVDPFPIARDTSSTMLQLGDSETSLIDNLRYSGVFERPEILGEQITHGPLMNGRHRIAAEFSIGNNKLSISGVQYETDGCYESKNHILIIEGKSTKCKTFNIRQLYFPYREAMRLSSGKKKVACLFIHSLNDVIHIWKYDFTDVNVMDSIRMTGHYAYKFIH